MFSARSELDGIGEQVEQDLLQPGTLAENENRPSLLMDLDDDSALLRLRRDRSRGAVHDLRQIAFFRPQKEFSFPDACGVEQVLDETRLLTRALFDRSEGLILDERIFLAPQQGRPAEDTGHRSLQFVRSDRQKAILGANGLPGVFVT